jgi:hypothetical protein
MATFTAQVFQNPYLARGASLVHAVVSVTCAGTPALRRSIAQAFLIDCSNSMSGEKIRCAQAALEGAIDLLPDNDSFCVVAGSASAALAYPLSPATREHKAAARAAVGRLKAGGGTAMSTWLDLARRELDRAPEAVRRALLLTDGKNESEPEERLSAVLDQCDGRFQCDARGVGTDWVPDQLRRITGRLLGTLDVIPRAADIAADFRRVLGVALGQSVGDVALRLWVPAGAAVEFCRLVHPEKHDLTRRARTHPDRPQVRDYPTAAWGADTRDFHLCIRVPAGQVGERKLAGRVSVVIAENGRETKAAEALVLAAWTDDVSQSSIIHPTVAHYSAQAELADSIQEGLRARAAGDDERAAALLGRSMQIASASNPETMQLLQKVVEVSDDQNGTVMLLADVRKEDEFALDARSARTAPVEKPLPGVPPASPGPSGPRRTLARLFGLVWKRDAAMPLCPHHHDSADADFCSVCGAELAGPAAVAPAAAACPVCTAPLDGPRPDVCPVCGHDYRAAPAPAPLPPALPVAVTAPPARWDVVLQVDPALYGKPNPKAPAGRPEQTFTLFDSEVMIGRANSGVRVQVPVAHDPSVSRRHALLVRRADGGLAVRDLGSSNGTQVNGVALTAGVDAPLRDGDTIAVGGWTRITVRAVRP